MPDQTTMADREVFLKWHALKVQHEYLFDLDYELEAYCISDVDILRRCLLKFRRLLLDVSDTDPLQDCTAAGLYIVQNSFYA